MLEQLDLTQLIFGRLSWDAIPLHDPVIVATFVVVAIGGAALLGALTYYRVWGYLWKEWFTSIDHKKIGIMYMVLGLVMLLRGFADAIMMRIQQAWAFGDATGYLPPDHYDQIFTAHGVIMIFFVAMPLITGIMNYIIPLQIGARDVAFPFLNNFSFWMTASGAALVMASLFIGEFAKTGWLAYPPLSGIMESPGVGVDYYLWALQIAGVGTLLSGINLLVTIVKMRAPGMNLMKMPVFTWTSLCTNVLIVAAFPVLTAVLGMLLLDRYLGTAFFTNDLGGNVMMYINLIWIWGHPEVYILILPAFGIFSEVVSTYSGKRLFGYASMVYATVVITVLSYMVWLHHFFTMGSGASVNSFFGITTMIISIPTGAKIFNWLFTMYRGRIRFEVPMLWTIGFIITFVIGGMTGVLLAVPPADFVLHNSLFLVAHFHNVIIGGVLFGLFAGITYWYPKAFGYKLDPFWGKMSFWFWTIGFYFAFMPLYVLGLMGVTRRMSQFEEDAAMQFWFQVAAFGAFLIALGILFFIVQLVVSHRRRDQLRDTTGDPWDGRTLEWATSSPPPQYNFAFTPRVHDLDAWWQMKQHKYRRPEQGFKAIHMPKNTAAGIILAGISTVLGFALVWHMWLLAGVSFAALLAVAIGHTFNYDRDYHIPAEEVERVEAERTRMLASHV
ncbi:MAG: cytochrome o ubiquinol oxidase subunit I [Alcanivorax sp.]|mgnify:FL=1|jgi:cytochrome o ubiquinol oxidase subunit 1|uniref:Cytochrome bo(3) ubiquinol oxidase subunit 1 n=1 Tax=Alloalcanivorax venustensis ISO4 TaxID=1177184 RepID=A0ABS0AG54_9GAMM|nr:cytochrome o ubiquinol oxidase subunit I [Alloalcanivorax venustensis]MBD3649996.1 cytochrome o ubiquinol oxidase subunit I [Alcanivorax sp.]MBF5053135.1 cytochrome O ubiquinol oxidase subunit I [Alloalcanivorax venustensis ISO4]HAD46960.1 cytochrome o ubiquinol oxidase subunit I [Alcanivorax sp.]HAI36119.1 cytochrome o ubiquinol oxidase subunit I [Alcanivorax sp.]HBP93553.1 cytochrome o ubiquinol oxidase subunit I [Alcanivorax sp.]|tara:strand:- start:6273 stop:8279 length:2007 start_codon:yes stop_codon:yes gene_type:complete